jgi:hypothetical protein
MSLSMAKPSPVAILAAVARDMRAGGDTGHVEDLLQAAADVTELAAASRALCDHITFRIDDPRMAMHDRLRLALARFGDTP